MSDKLYDYLRSILFGIVEGLTEFLPVSSTAHIRLTQEAMDISLDDPYWKMYAIVIQLGAILSVLVYFRSRIMGFLRTFPRGDDGTKSLWTHPLSLVLLAFTITAGPCLLIDKTIGENLESLTVMGVALLAGGVVMWVVDVWAGKRERLARAAEGAPPLEAPTHPDPAHPHLTAPADFEATPARPRRNGLTWRLEDMTFLQAIVIGAAQILSAAFPGTSRSMSTIAAGQLMRLSRPAALEFSFFLSIPVMVGATGLKLFQAASQSIRGELGFVIDAHAWGVLAVGFFVSFIVALAVIHWFMAWVRNHGFVPFAIYRIIAGLAVLGLALRSGS